MSSLNKIKKRVKAYQDKVLHESLRKDIAEAKEKGEIPQMDADLKKELDLMNGQIDVLMQSNTYATNNLFMKEGIMAEEATKKRNEILELQKQPHDRVGMTAHELQLSIMLSNVMNYALNNFVFAENPEGLTPAEKKIDNRNLDVFMKACSGAQNAVHALPTERKIKAEIKRQAEEKAKRESEQAPLSTADMFKSEAHGDDL